MIYEKKPRGRKSRDTVSLNDHANFAILLQSKHAESQTKFQFCIQVAEKKYFEMKYFVGVVFFWGGGEGGSYSVSDRRN
jgi:hypothetical protein